MTDNSEEVTQWIAGLAQGDQQAARLLWGAYFDKLVRYAHRKLDGMQLRSADEEDVALSAMKSFCQGMVKHSFDEVGSRDDLWKLLVTITARKICAQRRRHFAAKRGGGRVSGESVFLDKDEDSSAVGIAAVLGREPTPELACAVAEDCRQMLDRLGDESLRRVAIWRLEGYTVEEIAAKFGCVQRTVERKLNLIRAIWEGAEA